MGNTTVTPRLGRTVLYTLNEQDVREIVQRALDAQAKKPPTVGPSGRAGDSGAAR